VCNGSVFFLLLCESCPATFMGFKRRWMKGILGTRNGSALWMRCIQRWPEKWKSVRVLDGSTSITAWSNPVDVGRESMRGKKLNHTPTCTFGINKTTIATCVGYPVGPHGPRPLLYLVDLWVTVV
jgi:hypothetical protein